MLSPFQAILDYERSNNIPIGWINHAIASSNPSGAWQRLERGEVSLDAAFFRAFHADLTNEKLWKQYHLLQLRKSKNETSGQAAEETAFDAPPPPTHMDAEFLFWEMMRVSRDPDPNMFPALKRLRKHADDLAARRGGGGNDDGYDDDDDANARPRQRQQQRQQQEQQPFIIAALSNTSIFPADHAYNDPTTPSAQFATHLRSLFDLYVSSAHVGLRKPDPAIYAHTLQSLRALAAQKGWFGRHVLQAADVVFLDDIGSNLRTARAAGMRTIKVQLGQTDKAVGELERVMGLELGGGGGGGETKEDVKARL